MSKNGGERGRVIANPKNFIANLRKLTHIYELSQKKRNVISKRSRPFGLKKKDIQIWGDGHP